MRLRHLVAVSMLIGGLSVPASAAPAWAAGFQAANEEALARDVRQELSRVRDLRRLTVSVSGSEVTLRGEVPSLWLREEAIRRARTVRGVDSLATDIDIPPRSTAQLARDVGRAIDDYPQLGVFDYVTGTVRDGVVTLVGSVTPTGRKADEVLEAVMRVRGVQAVHNEILTLPPAMEDDRIRAELAARIRSNLHLQPLIIGRPAFSIVVHNGVISLHGVVPGEVEYRQFEMVARETTGVLRVHNHLQRMGPNR